jgi:KaiC/GvpD/RAD55 family RecA-like ATPase
MKTDKLTRIKSGLSEAFWCDTSFPIANFERARIDFDTSEKQYLSWFDMLFEGGLLLPQGEGTQLSPLTMLVSGPPGSGKTTFVTELCYRLALNEQENPQSLSTLYISTDAETDRMIQNSISFGWDKASDYFVAFNPEDKNPRLKRGLKSMVGVWGREKFLHSIQRQELLSEIIEGAVNSLDKWILKANPKSLKNRISAGIRFKPIQSASSGEIESDGERYIPDILVVDSLNILNPKGQAKFFQSFVQSCKATKLVIFILNTGTTGQDHKLWEYYSDIVLQLDYDYIHDYYIRTIEIVKARFQTQRWGKHQLKIYANPKKLKKPGENDLIAIQEYNTVMRRTHPYRPTGGVFIFPSIHSYLSVYKRKTVSEKSTRDDTYPNKLNQIFELPTGRCTAFIGKRGGHKSHLGYLHLLYRLLKKNSDESGLIVSLREDEATTKNTLVRIAKEEFDLGKESIDCLEKGNHLEILYFPPGYITPEEFFHRIFISVHRLKKSDGHLTVLFNSLDQISARFPLCAKQEIFIPGIIQTLSGVGATSICIAVDEPGQPVQQYGLLPMSDLIVSFALRRFSAISYYNHLSESWGEELQTNGALNQKFLKLQNAAAANHDLMHEAVVIQVVRFSGGERRGKRGILELVKNDELETFPYSRPGLHFTPLSEELTQGEPLPD